MQKAVDFYRDGLGLPTKGIIGQEHEYGAVAFFDLAGGLKLAVWPYESIAHDTGLKHTGHNSAEFTLGHNVNSKKEVDDVFAKAIAAGATKVKPPQDTFWGGYSGYFQDPDGHVWEIVWSPEITV